MTETFKVRTTVFEVGKTYKHNTTGQIIECTGVTTSGKAAMKSNKTEWLGPGSSSDAWKEYTNPKYQAKVTVTSGDGHSVQHFVSMIFLTEPKVKVDIIEVKTDNA